MAIRCPAASSSNGHNEETNPSGGRRERMSARLEPKGSKAGLFDLLHAVTVSSGAASLSVAAGKLICFAREFR